MPSREYHLRRDVEAPGGPGVGFPEVHRLLDQFAHYPDMNFLREHRKFLHHKEGIDYIAARYGELAGLSALQHVKDDCEGNVPHAVDYYTGQVDNFGCLVPKRHRKGE